MVSKGRFDSELMTKRCGKGSAYFCLTTGQSRSGEAPVRNCGRSRTQFFTDCKMAVSDKLSQYRQWELRNFIGGISKTLNVVGGCSDC